VFDFRSLLGLSWWVQVEEGDPWETECLVAGLHRHSRSLYRAAVLRDSPAPDGQGDDTAPMRLDWLGLDDQTVLLARIHNMLAKRGQVLGPERAPSEEEQRQAMWLALVTPG